MAHPRSIKDAEGVRSKKNATGSDIGANLVVKLDSTTGQIVLPGATTDHLYGVTLTAIKNGQWGDVQIRGRAVCKANAALATPGVLLKAETTGKVSAWSAGAGTNCHVVGTLETTAGADGDLVEVELAGPGVIKQG